MSKFSTHPFCMLSSNMDVFHKMNKEMMWEDVVREYLTYTSGRAPMQSEWCSSLWWESIWHQWGNLFKMCYFCGFSDLLLHLLIHKTTYTKYLADLLLLRFKLKVNLNIKHCSLTWIHLLFWKYVFPLARFLKAYLTFPVSLGKLILLK